MLIYPLLPYQCCYRFCNGIQTNHQQIKNIERGRGGEVRNVFEFSIGFQHDLFRRKSNFGVEPVSTIAIARRCSISLVSLKLFYLVTVDPDLDEDPAKKLLLFITTFSQDFTCACSSKETTEPLVL